MLLWRRFIGSVGRRGLLKTVLLVPRKIGVLASVVVDWFWDVRNRTDTMNIIELDELDITSANKDRGIRYQPTRARPFVKVMSALKLPVGGGFVDFGCGKGRVLMMASEFGFERLTGVDFSGELCERARENLRGYLSRRRRSAEIDIHHADAVDYPVREDDVVFYFYNPFDDVVLDRVLDNVVVSLESSPREIYLIYNNPLWRGAIERRPMFDKVAAFEHAENRFLVYSNKRFLTS